MKRTPFFPQWLARAGSETGAAVLIAILVTMVLIFLGLSIVLSAITDTIISKSNRYTLKTYYVAEAGIEEGIKKIATTNHGSFNPNSYTGSFPVEVTRCFFNDNSAPACPVTLGNGTLLTAVPVTVGDGNYRLQISYLGRFTDANNQIVHKYLLASSGTSNNSTVASNQTVSSQIYVTDLTQAFPPHPLTSCTDPAANGTYTPTGQVPPGIIDPTAPPTWPGTGSTNYGVTPSCDIPNAGQIQNALRLNADYSYSTSITDSSPLPPQFWKIPPTGDPPDPTTGVPYIVYVNGDLTVNGNGTIHGIYYLTGSIIFNGSASLDGVVYAPHGTLFTGHGGGNPNQPDGVGGIFANSLSSTGNHYYTLWNSTYTNAYLGQVPQRLSRGGR